MDTLTQLDAWLEDHLPANLAALPTRIADSLSSTFQIIIDSSHTVITTLTHYGPVFPSSSSPTESTTATNDDGLFDFWRISPPPPSPTMATTTTTTSITENNKHSLSLFTATASTATLIALGIISLILIPPPRPGLKAHYGGPILLPYLPGDLPTHIHSLFSSSSKKPPLRRQISSSSAGRARTEAVLDLGADTPLGRTISLHLATQGYIVHPVVSSPQALHIWAALTPPSSRGYIAPLLLAIRDESEAAFALEGFRGELEGVSGRRFPLTTAGEPYARPEEKIRLIGVVNTLSFFLLLQAPPPPSFRIKRRRTSKRKKTVKLPHQPNQSSSARTSPLHIVPSSATISTNMSLPLSQLSRSSSPSSANTPHPHQVHTLLTSLILNLRAVGSEGGALAGTSR
ncbi:hypothetical protein A4X13_0g6519 [Tilletia indica]|uniref:Uncharacterized protein n=1 Tax=Tilletia indica TaxID=43049 RepID=A0A8T8SPN8_9BASI|nr:hypothetical protein A4X13_0g6519 [Tilletia indica]